MAKKDIFDVYVPFWRNEFHGELANCCRYDKTAAWDAAIAMYDKGIAPDGYPFKKNRDAKIRFLRRKGLRMKLAYLVMKE